MRYDKIRSRVRQNSFSFENMIVIVIILIFFVIIGGTCATKFISSKEKLLPQQCSIEKLFILNGRMLL